VSKAGHAIVDMADFSARDQAPARVCLERVRECDVYVGIYGLRYGTPIRGRRNTSYTEWEFDAASAAGKPRLIFLLDPASTASGLPPKALIDRRHGKKQDAFVQRVQACGLTVRRFRHPDDLHLGVYQALMELRMSSRREGPGAGRAAVREVPKLLPYAPDRHQQEERLRAALRKLLAAELTAPLVVILHGEEDQRLERFRDRVLQHSLSSMVGSSLATRDHRVPWPGDLEPGDRFFEEFRQRIVDHLSADDGGPLPFPPLGQDSGELMVLWSSLYTDDWGRQGARVFAEVCRFWRESKAFAHHRLIHWILITYKKPPAYQPEIPILRWLERRYWHQRLSRHRLRRRNRHIRSTLHTLARSKAAVPTPVVLPELRSIGRADAEGWVHSPEVRTFLGEQSPQTLEDAVSAYYRRWESEHGMAEIPLEQLGNFLRDQLERAAAGDP